MKDFVPYNELLELKQLGFDEPCFGYYVELKNPQEGLLKIGLNDDFLQAPTFSQAFRFFREKYDLPVPYIQKLTKMGEIFYVAQIIHLMSPIKTVTYEEAELACLQKLIQIVKNEKLTHSTNR